MQVNIQFTKQEWTLLSADLIQHWKLVMTSNNLGRGIIYQRKQKDVFTRLKRQHTD